MIRFTAIDSGHNSSGDSASDGAFELLQLAGTILQARLFTDLEQEKFMLQTQVAGQLSPVPIQRRQMVGKSGFRPAPPREFSMLISLVGGLAEAIDMLAHELIHIAQLRSGRLRITAKKLKLNGVRQLVYLAKWGKEKPVVIDHLSYHERGWELEACQWQSILRIDATALMLGAPHQLCLQSAKGELSLYEAASPMNFGPVDFGPVDFGFDTQKAPVRQTEVPKIAVEAPPLDEDILAALIAEGEFDTTPKDTTPKDATPTPKRKPRSRLILSAPDHLAPDHLAPNHLAPNHLALAQPAVEVPTTMPTTMPATMPTTMRGQAFSLVDVEGVDTPRPLSSNALDAKLKDLQTRGLANSGLATIDINQEKNPYKPCKKTTTKPDFTKHLIL